MLKLRAWNDTGNRNKEAVFGLAGEQVSSSPRAIYTSDRKRFILLGTCSKALTPRNIKYTNQQNIKYMNNSEMPLLKMSVMSNFYLL